MTVCCSPRHGSKLQCSATSISEESVDDTSTISDVLVTSEDKPQHWTPSSSSVDTSTHHPTSSSTSYSMERTNDEPSTLGSTVYPHPVRRNTQNTSISSNDNTGVCIQYTVHREIFMLVLVLEYSLKKKKKVKLDRPETGSKQGLHTTKILRGIFLKIYFTVTKRNVNLK